MVSGANNPWLFCVIYRSLVFPLRKDSVQSQKRLCRSPLLMAEFCMPHQVVWCSAMPANDRECPVLPPGGGEAPPS
jgi:hypothetical protein